MDKYPPLGHPCTHISTNTHHRYGQIPTIGAPLHTHTYKYPPLGHPYTHTYKYPPLGHPYTHISTNTHTYLEIHTPTRTKVNSQLPTQRDTHRERGSYIHNIQTIRCHRQRKAQTKTTTVRETFTHLEIEPESITHTQTDPTDKARHTHSPQDHYHRGRVVIPGLIPSDQGLVLTESVQRKAQTKTTTVRQIYAIYD